MNVRRYPSAGALTEAAAERFVGLANTAIVDRGRFAVALAGGSTPRTLYRLLATDRYATRIDWQHVHVLWGDERCVPPDHGDSNYRMADEELLSKVPLPRENVHRIRGEIKPNAAAAEYERLLRSFFHVRDAPNDPSGGDRLDLVLLGMGDDGHTASLFPGSEAVQLELRRKQDRWVVANFVERLGAWRVTLTTIPINAAREVVFLVSGAGKASVLQRVLEGPRSRELLPVELVTPMNGQLLWLVDEEAAGGVAIEATGGPHPPVAKPG